MEHVDNVLSVSGRTAQPRWSPSSQDVQDIWEHFCRKYGTEIVDKHDSDLMSFISRILAISPGMTRESFIENYVTVIGKKIYAPFAPGDQGDGVWSLWSQLIVCAHEHQHVIQYGAHDVQGAVGFSVQYLTQKPRRTRFEIEAYTTALELHFWRSGQVLDPAPIIRSLASYRVKELDLKVAKAGFNANNRMIARGAVITEAGAEAIQWLRDRGIDPL
ncbi:MAG: hypothetical protein LAT68_17360 [Cyclobacteriaceae bacterium]|nr:hypothetical protein [Cyclobacteriaceae bacterium]